MCSSSISFVYLRTLYPKWSTRYQWFYKFLLGQSKTILLALHFENVANVHLDRIYSSNGWTPFSTWSRFCEFRPILLLVIVVNLSLAGFYPMLSALFWTADVMDLIYNVSASRVVAFLEFFEEFCFFWYAANFKVIWRKWALVLSPVFFVAKTSLSSGPVPLSASLCSIISCCFLTSLYLVSTKLNVASSVFSSGFTEKIVSNSSINSYKRLRALSSFPARVFTSLWAEFKCETWRLLVTRRNLLQQVLIVSLLWLKGHFKSKISPLTDFRLHGIYFALTSSRRRSELKK